MHEINKRYDHLLNKEYVALSLRSKDTDRPIPPEDIAYLNDVNLVANRLVEAVENHTKKESDQHIRNVFIGKPCMILSSSFL